MRTGIANLPLHYGQAPKWLFDRMVKLGAGISSAVVNEYGQDEFLRRLSDPHWFQAFGCVLGFDWHSSGLTTTVCGALKEGLKNENLGLVVAGGKGKTSQKTPQEILEKGSKLNLSTQKIEKMIYSSKMAAKVDNCAVQDGYNLYHHVFIFSEKGKWAVIQQGMNNLNQYARRYHWLSDQVKDFVNEPQAGICCDKKEEKVLNMVAPESKESRKLSVDLVNDNPHHIFSEMGKLEKGQKTLYEYPELSLSQRHYIIPSDLSTRGIKQILLETYEKQPENYEQLLGIKGVGPKTIRALALISELIYGSKPCWKDPVKYSFSHGGKDGIPYPVNRERYDQSIRTLKDAIESAKVGQTEKLGALKRLSRF